MKTEIDTVKIVMTVDEAKGFAEDMANIFQNLASALSAVYSDTTIDQLMADNPFAARFYTMIKVYENPNPELPF